MKERVKRKTNGKLSKEEKAERRRAKAAEFLQDMEEGLQIDENALDEALQEQPHNFYKVSKELALATSRRDAAKHALASAEADADAEIRREAADNDAKITEKEVESRKRGDDRVVEANDILMELNKEVGQLLALKEAYSTRSYVLKDLVSLWVANYYGDATQRASGDAVRNRNSERAKDLMSRKRSERSA